jgi:hypothetical protein|tara:strand:- start:6353 stop:6655 length:303 start_codon:yes stop_codon:yes gene_type:complete
MDKKEAMEAMLDGKKVCRVDWIGDKNFIDYIHLSESFVDEDGDAIHIGILMKDDATWEIYEEPKETISEMEDKYIAAYDKGYKEGYEQALKDALNKVNSL